MPEQPEGQKQSEGYIPVPGIWHYGKTTIPNYCLLYKHEYDEDYLRVLFCSPNFQFRSYSFWGIHDA